LFGLATTVQLLPFQDSINVREKLPFGYEPTAAHDVADTHHTPFNWFLPAPLFGLATSVQALPFQDSINVRETLLLLRYEPTALHDVDEAHDTLFSWLFLVPLLGLATAVHVLPFQDSTRVRYALLPHVVYEPTALHDVTDAHDRPFSWLLLVPGFGLATNDQLLPFHDSINVCRTPAKYQPTAWHEVVDVHTTAFSR
jgi:hypothetical protein